jgi:outer membrane protein assembly factor BamB
VADLRRSRRTAAAAAALVAVVLAVAAWFAVRPHGAASDGGAAGGTGSTGVQAGVRPTSLPAHAKTSALSLPAAESGLLPWHLPEPLSRAVVTAGSPGQLVVAGGRTADGAPASAVYDVNTGTGTARRTGTLRAPRLATADGQPYRTVATLPVPVRDPAVAALGGRIYVFGGLALTGPHAGSPVSVIQAVDPARRTAAVVGHLPVPLAGAAAVAVDGELFVAGGESSAAGRQVAGLGTTQLAGQPTARAGMSDAASPTRTDSAIWAYDPASGRLLAAGRLQVPVSYAGIVAVGSTAWSVGGESDGALVSSVQLIRPDRSFGTAGAPGAGSPYFGDKLLIADRGNNRLLVLDAAIEVTWMYPAPSVPRNPPRFYFPDDAFFTDHGTEITVNQEENETIVRLAYPSGKIIWSYGHALQPGTSPGYLHEPDDAYLLKNGQVTVADVMNCRVLVINENHTVARQIGTDGECFHNPPSSMGSPNGDTPLTDGDLLISEINGSWVSEYTLTGKLVWAVQLAVVGYPSDPQQVGPDSYLLADYSEPGQFVEFDRHGKIRYRYDPSSGPGMLNHPSLAEVLPSGVIMANDDYNDRMVAIDPATGALVWQYGITGKPGTATGQLNIPDGFDLLLPNGSTPTHPATG